MRSALLLMALALGTLTAQAQPGPAVTKGHDRYEEPGFGALAFLISDSTFFERWERPETPRIQDDTHYARGEVAYPVVIFQTDALDESGHADLTYDLTVTRPDGTPYAGTPMGLFARGLAPADGRAHRVGGRSPARAGPRP